VTTGDQAVHDSILAFLHANMIYNYSSHPINTSYRASNFHHAALRASSIHCLCDFNPTYTTEQSNNTRLSYFILFVKNLGTT